MEHDELFRFKIGDVVKHAVDPEGVGPKLLVTSRLLEQCPGGTQLHYHARAWTATNNMVATSNQYARFNEVELRAMTESEREYDRLSSQTLVGRIFKMQQDIDNFSATYGRDAKFTDGKAEVRDEDADGSEEKS